MLLLVPLLAVTILPGSEALLLDSTTCPLATPCICYSTTITCASHRLTAIPSFNFTTVDIDRRSLSIHLEGNEITSIPANAFNNIHLFTVTSYEVQINLKDNNITTIDDDAFQNLENASLVLDLSNNGLKSLPQAFVQLNKLKELRILGNPLVFLGQAVMEHLGHSLQTLWLGMKMMAIWPQDLAQLSNLRSLSVDEIPFHSLPLNAFHGLDRLYRLEITKPRLETIPKDICSFGSLHSFSGGTLSVFKFSEDNSISNNVQSFFSLCGSNKIYKMKSVLLTQDQLYSFPKNLFEIFPNLDSLDLSNNNLATIPDEDVPLGNKITSLDLPYNAFTSIPQVISKMSSLRSLNIRNNKITFIGDNIFSAMAQFRTLIVSGNPLMNIDPHAFSFTNTLSRLEIENTNMTYIPAAILHSSAFSFRLEARHSPIHCTCGSMYFLKAWSADMFTHYKKVLDGSCVSNSSITMSLRSYVQHELVNC